VIIVSKGRFLTAANELEHRVMSVLVLRWSLLEKVFQEEIDCTRFSFIDISLKGTLWFNVCTTKVEAVLLRFSRKRLKNAESYSYSICTFFSSSSGRKQNRT